MDANKRTALNAALTFLQLNGHTVRSEADDELVEMTVKIAEGHLEKDAIAAMLRSLVEV